MPEAICYGLFAALAFIGFVSIIYYTILWIYRPKGCGKYIVIIPEDADKCQIRNLVYGAYMRNILFGDTICDDVTIVDFCMDEALKNITLEISQECDGISIRSVEDIVAWIAGKDNDGESVS